MQPFTERVLKIIKQIPSGYVMTYGQIAALAGSKRAARQVVRILHSMSEKYSLPWHRVVNAKGEISINDQELSKRQKELLVLEGVLFSEENTINLAKFRFAFPFIEEEEDFQFQ